MSSVAPLSCQWSFSPFALRVDRGCRRCSARRAPPPRPCRTSSSGLKRTESAPVGSNRQQWVNWRRHPAVSVPELLLDVVDEHGGRPGEQRRDDGADALPRPGRREHEDVLRPVVADQRPGPGELPAPPAAPIRPRRQARLRGLAEHDAGVVEQPGVRQLPPSRPPGRPVRRALARAADARQRDQDDHEADHAAAEGERLRNRERARRPVAEPPRPPEPRPRRVDWRARHGYERLHLHAHAGMGPLPGLELGDQSAGTRQRPSASRSTSR